MDGVFLNWTSEGVKVGTVVAKREDVRKIERYRHGGSRAEHAGFGAMIGFVAGFAGGASHPFFNTPAQEGALAGGVGAAIGAIIGALLPTHSKELIYLSGLRGSRTSNRATSRNDGGPLAALP